MAEKSIADKVRFYIDSDPYIKNCLERGIINIRALARVLADEINAADSQYAIINAIRRYPVKEQKKEKTIEKLLKNAKISLKNKIADVLFEPDPYIQSAITKIIPHIKFESGEILRVFAGVEAIKVILDEKNLDILHNYLPKTKIRKINRNLAEITISGPPELERVPGGIAKLATLLALNQINIVEMMYSYTDFIIIVDEKDAIISYKILSSLA